MKSFNVILVLAVFLCSVLRGQDNKINTSINNLIGTQMPSSEQLYRYLHTNPELSLMEKNTSERLAKEMRDIGFEVTTNVGGYGVVGIMKNGSGLTLMLR